jgi:hypothetical protein
MGHGLGPTQRAILAALDTSEDVCMTVPELATELQRSQRQIRTAVHALETRGLVIVKRGHTGWRGRGEYGRLSQRWRERDASLPTALTVKAGERWPGSQWYRARRDTEFVRNGMPTYGLLVWSLAKHAEKEARYAELVAKARKLLGTD